MLTSEERALLGMTPELMTARRPTAVSQILRVLDHERDRDASKWDVDGGGGLPSFRVLVAADRKTRARAYALAHRVYKGCGYAPGDEGMLVSPSDASPQTLTLLVQDGCERDAATITLVFDSPGRLPCDEIYALELDALRAQSRRLVEVTRLAIDEKHQRSKTLLVRLFNFIYVFAKRVRGFDDFVIEVNPRHVNYYRRLLAFEQAGPERACPRVQGAPAVLLRLDLSIPEREVRRVGGKGAAANERTLYPHFFSWLEESAVARFLARAHKPMTEADAHYFGLNQRGSLCV